MTTETADNNAATTAPIIAPTENALSQIKRILEQEGLLDQAVRVGISDRSPTGFSYQLEFCDRSEKTDKDTVLEHGELMFLIDADSVEDLRGTTLDYVDTGFSAGFKFDNPNKPKLMQDPIAVRVQEVIKERINPGVASHGGHVTLLDVRDGTAYVKLGGGCQGCGHADTTVKQGIETMICEAVPEVHTVLDVTDHAAGENPYYQG
jgi:Fe/S biogenesis protein NfuA